MFKIKKSVFCGWLFLWRLVGHDNRNKLDICMKTEMLQLSALKDVLNHDLNSRVSEDLARETQTQHLHSGKLQDCSKLCFTGKGLCLQSAFMVQCATSTTSLTLCLFPLFRLVVLVYHKPVPEGLWHSAEWRKGYNDRMWFTPEYRVVLGNVLSSGTFSATAQDPRLLLRETITLGTEKYMQKIKSFLRSPYKCCYGQQHREFVISSVFPLQIYRQSETKSLKRFYTLYPLNEVLRGK